MLRLYLKILVIYIGCVDFMQSFLAGLAAAGALTSALRLITKASFDKYHDGLRKGTSMLKFLLIIVDSSIFIISRLSYKIIIKFLCHGIE